MPSFAARPQGGGTAPRDERAVFTAVVYVLTTGSAWRPLPPALQEKQIETGAGGIPSAGVPSRDCPERTVWVALGHRAGLADAVAGAPMLRMRIKRRYGEAARRMSGSCPVGLDRDGFGRGGVTGRRGSLRASGVTAEASAARLLRSS
ncbi:hypothetical protein ACFU6R_11380 [Streptomyces sp. NPDC057499]|uniref:hypothetical protein n=1 Tax=Streptomyces sp. NPDC057499 TaxID=3346150 RepID=UPI00367B729A